MSKEQVTIVDQAVFKAKQTEIVEMQNRKHIFKKISDMIKLQIRHSRRENLPAGWSEASIEKAAQRRRGGNCDKKYKRYREFISEDVKGRTGERKYLKWLMAEMFLEKRLQSSHFESPRHTKKLRPGYVVSLLWNAEQTKAKILKPEDSGIIKELKENKGQFF